ncbi:MAG: MucB/RseB C-terminal domain-containing protein [Cellvibrionaceae bacterium]
MLILSFNHLKSAVTPVLPISRAFFSFSKYLALSLALTLGSHAAVASESPEQVAKLLADMSQALREKDYRGLFTYEFGGALQTLRITHQVIDGVEYEHLEYLNGPSRRIERNGRDVSCLSPADKVLQGLLPSLEGNFHGLNQHYHFYIRDQQRVAGRPATMLQIVPRDEYRFGYTLSIDQETSLPLGTMTQGVNRRVLERLQFASLELEANDSWVETVETSARVKSVGQPSCLPPKDALGWDLDWIPSGFLPAGSSVVDGAGEVRLFTDGLSAFSVFVQPMGESVAAQGKAQRGATVAYMQQQLFGSIPHTITVVGEIPARAAQRIAGSVRPAAAPSVSESPSTSSSSSEDS